MDLELTLILNSNSNPVVAGDSVNIICGARINKTLVDIDVNVDVHLISPGINATEQEVTVRLSPGLYQRSISFDSVSAQNSGLFVCNATVQSSITNVFVQSAYKHQTFDLILGNIRFINVHYIIYMLNQFPLALLLAQSMFLKVLSALHGLKFWVIELTTI